jgi:pimeloyl-ACP methyl ester carboxylesterase
MQKNFEYKSSIIHYSIQGTGQPVVLLHGFGEDSSIWQVQANFLSDHFQIIAPDLPGSGNSSFLEKEGASIKDYATILFALLEEEKIGQCILLGHSMGGYITLAFAEMYPEKLMAFGLINSTAFADSEEKKASRVQGIKMIEGHGAFAFLKTAIPTLFSTGFKNEHADKVSALIEKGKQFSNEALVQYYTAMMNRPDTTSVLEKSEVPVLFIIGTEDNAAPLNDLLKQVHLPKNAQIHILDGVGHMSMIEVPEKLNKHLLEFLENL